MANSKDRLAGSLSKVPSQPPLRKAPQHYPLSTDSNAQSQDSDSALTQNNTNALEPNRTNALTQDSDNAQSQNNTIAKKRNNTEPENEPKRVSRGYKLREDLIKACKRIALEDDRLLYEVMEEALETYINNYQNTQQKNTTR